MHCTVPVTEKHYGDSPYRPDTHCIIIPGKRGKLLSMLYTAAGPGLHPTVLLLHGIPGCEKNLDLAHALRRAGFHVLIFHYSGSWGSEGCYTLENDVEDANTALDFILADETYGFDKSHIYAVGHSMGGFVCGQLTAKREEIHGGVLLMPCDIGRVRYLAAENPQAMEGIRAVLADCANWLTGVTEDSLVREAEINAERFSLENLSGKLSKKPLLCVGGTLDTCTPPVQNCQPLEQAITARGGKLLQSLRYPTDHFFSDYRFTVAQTVIDFLNGLLSC